MAARAAGLVSSSTVAASSSGRPVAAESIQRLVDCHVGSQKHWLEAFEVPSTGEVSSVEYHTHVGPFCVHRT